ncbi:MAG: hypothetical protein CBC24_07545 [Candidatus Pelagibacter sp. TMED64]|nr:MAG: hypothetical protein CBC24_07545 [Candidatus Pelagibacter sp. TMED64]
MEVTIDEALRRGIHAQNEGRFQEAERIYRSILQSSPQHGDANHNLGVLAVHFGKIDLALPHFKTALEANANQEQYWVSYIEGLIRFGQLESARQVLAQGRQRGLKGDKVDQLEQQANGSEQASVSRERASEVITLYKQGNLDEALVRGRALLQQFPDDPNVPNILGAIHSSLGQHDAAIDYYMKAIELRPHNVQAHNNLGNALNELNRFEEAITHYNKAIELKPDYPEAHYNLGIVLSEVKRYEEAITHYNKAIELKSDYAEVHNNLAITYDLLDKLDLAVVHYSKAIDMQPNQTEIQFNLAHTLRKMKKFEKAIPHYSQAIALKPSYLNAYLELGMLKHSEGSHDDATRLYRFSKILRHSTGIEAVYLNHLKLWIDQKNTTQSRSDLSANYGVDGEAGFIRTTIPVDPELPKILCSLPTLSPHDESKEVEHKSASQIRRGGVQHSKGFNLFDSNQPDIKQLKDKFVNTVSTLLNSSIFIDDSFFAIYQGTSAAQPHHHLNEWDREFNLHSVKYAAVYYLAVGDTAADEPGNLKLHSPDILIEPEVGDLVIFPASRTHSAYYNGVEKRIILGVNFYKM